MQPAGAQLTVRLTPRAARDELTGMRDGVLHARVAAPPVDGKANRALCRLIARAADVAPSRVSIVRGDTARVKVVRVDAIADDALRRALGIADDA